MAIADTPRTKKVASPAALPPAALEQIAQTDQIKPGKPGTQPKFQSPDLFLNELRKRVDHYFETTGLPRRDCPAMYCKTFIVLAWYFTSYALLVFFATSLWQAIPLAIVMGVAMAAIGFNIQHDGGHCGYSEKPWINRLMAMAMDLMGASSYIWRQQHNIVHHSYANVDEHDADISLGPLARLCPNQKRYWYHRFQHIYLWALYTFVSPKWQFHDDFRDLIRGQICDHKFPFPRGKELAILIGGKLTFVTMAFVIPMMFHSWWMVLAFYALASAVQGVILAVVIQLAHAVEEAEFPLPNADNRLESSWAVHQVQTTVDYARNSKFWSWYTGGLNFQTEHHLFSRICHINYPAMSEIVKEACEDFGLRYEEHPTFWAGVKSHYRWLRMMGRPVEENNTTSGGGKDGEAEARKSRAANATGTPEVPAIALRV